MDKKVLNFELSSQNIQIKSVLANDFLQIEVWAISDIYPNRNGSHFSVDAIRDAIPTVFNKPALGAFNVAKNDFKAHDSVLAYDRELENEYFDYTNGKCEVALGVIRESDLVEVVEKDGENWLHFTCALWVKYGYKQIKRLLKDKDKKISVEIEVLEEHEDEQGIEVIDKFIFDGFTILGSDVTEAIPGAHLTIIDKTMQAIYQKRGETLSFAYKGLDEQFSETSAKIENKNISSEVGPLGGEVTPIPAEIEDENTEEIEMDKEFDEERRVNEKVELTYQQKRDILEVALQKHINDMHEDDVWGYIADMDSTHVYYRIQEEDFKAPYEITGEDELFATIDFAAAVRVVRSWQEYAAEGAPEDNPVAEPETFAEEGKGEEGDGHEECAHEEEAHEECADDGDEQDDDDDDGDEGHEECAADCNGEEGKEEDFTKVDGHETTEVQVNEDAHIIAQGVAAQTDDGKAQGPSGAPENIGGTLEGNGIRFTVKDEKGEDKELTFASTDELIADYQEKIGRLYTAETELNAKVREELYAYGVSYVDSETDLDEENATNIKSIFKADLDAGKYSVKADFEAALDRAIADALYAQKKAARSGEEKKEFSTNIVKDNLAIKHNADSDVEAIKNAANKLRNI